MSKCNQDDCHEDVRIDMDCPCEPFLQGSMDIIIEEQLEDGSPNQHKNTRYVKLCGSIEDCRIYPMIIDETTGMGTLHLEDISSVKNVLVLVDEHGQQLVNQQDAYEVSYYLDGEKVEEDYASVIMSCQEHEHHDIHIVIRQRETVCLEVTKILRNECMEVLALTSDMRFFIHLCGMGIKETIVLDAQNHFQVCIEHLLPGVYVIEEEPSCGYCTTYCFDGGEEKEESQITLTSGTHELQVINQQMSQSVLTIEKFIRDEGGELIKPQDDEQFEIRIIGDHIDRIYTLSCENDFSIEIENIEPGFYDISELTEDYEVSYIVNHQMESGYAHVEVRKCEASSVMIINQPMTCCECHSPLRICKYIRRCDGMLVKPDDTACFKVMLCGCGFYQTFNLNACNNFCVDIDHICCGEYEIREIDNDGYKTSYIVNDNQERTCAFICLHEHECNVVSIINEERNQGHVSICKFIRNECGELMKPMKGDRFVATLRSFFFNETFILDEHNDWCMHFDHLREGSYEVRERSMDGYDITYIVNGSKERKRARLIVDSDCENEIYIVNTSCHEDCGTLKICKYMALQNGDFVKPSIDESFEVLVQGPCIKETYTLHSRNNWCVILEGLEPGDYKIEEACHTGYDFSYLINGCKQEEAAVTMGKGNQEVSIINSRIRGGNLAIEIWIRDCEDALWKPCGDACFDVYVEHHHETKCYTLDSRNRWSILLDDLLPGKYRIIQKDNYGYDVSYEIDHEETPQGIVQLDGNDQSVKIINSLTNCQGMVTIKKWIVDECGNKTMPCAGCEFNFILRGAGFKKHFTLNDTNDFCVYFDDLREGTYHLEEEDSGYDTSYIIHDTQMKQGQFVLGREDIEIEVWNQAKPQPVVCIDKRVRRQGRLCMPDPCESYEFVITGKDVHEVYTLDISNNFTICLSELCQQHYEIKELHVEGSVSYLVDDTLQADGYFLFDGEDKNITIINEEGCDDHVRICKVVEDDHQICKPYRWESFDIQIEGRNYKHRFTLDCDNDWNIVLDHLAPGSYEIKELGDYENTFKINGETCQNGCFFVGGGDCDITIINHICCTGSLHIAAYDMTEGHRCLPQDGEYPFILSTDDWQQTYILNCENGWSLCFDELPAADYTLSSCDDSICFEIDDEISKSIHFHLECETKHAALLILPCAQKHKLTIRKQMRDAQGNVSTPSSDAYQVEVDSEDGKQIICLQEDNNYSTVLELPEGGVSVHECDHRDALYQINGGALQKKARFSLNEDSTLTIYNPSKASVCLQGEIETCDGKLVLPQPQDRFEITLKANQFCETISLNKQNHWCACFEHVPAGSYVLSSTTAGYKGVVFKKEEGLPSSEITVDSSDVSVKAVYQMLCPTGVLEILKYKKDSNCGCFVRPCQNESYEIHVWSDAFDEVFTLDSENSWRKRLTGLPAGEYHIEEQSPVDDVSYVVNGGKEVDHAVVHVDENASYVKVINAKRKENTGSIEICKFIKTACRMEKPQPGSEFKVLLKGPGGDQTFYLNDANEYCVTAQSLADGKYEIIEQSSDDSVSYIVNNGCEASKAFVSVMHNHNCVQVLNQPQIHGSMLLSKFVKDQDGKLHVPMGEEQYRVHVSKANFNKVITLSKDNNFKELLSDLDDGWYVVDELDHDNVKYRINGGAEVDSGMVQVRGDEQDIWLINPPSALGSITVTKYMRMEHHYQKPADDEIFQFHITRPGFHQLYTLNKDNLWTQVISGLEDGSYVIQEADNSYQTSYIINGGSESDYGIVDVKGNENTVFMINEETSHTGSIRIVKYIRNKQGQLVRPIGNYTAQVHVSRPGFHQIYDLNNDNDWTVYVTGLEDGQYVLDEVNDNTATYIINGGSEVNHGVVIVKGNQNEVQMINAEDNSKKGSIVITKYLRDAYGQLVRPTGNFTAQVRVSHPGFHETYELNRDNDWTVRIKDAEDGQYELEEVGDGNVSYIINGGNEVNHGMVFVAGNQNQVQMINHDVASTKLHLRKYMQGDHGEMIKPNPDMEFQIHLSSETIDQNITLHDQNDFHIILNDLPAGLYTVMETETEGYHTAYRINGGQPVSHAVFEIIDGLTTTVDIISEPAVDTGKLEVSKYILHPNGSYVKPSRQEEFKVRIFNQAFDQTYVLNDGNHWQFSTEELPAGDYELEEISNTSYHVRYRVNDDAYSDTASFHVMPGVHNVIEIVNDQKREQDGHIEFTKRMRSQTGDLVMPSSDVSFLIRMQNQAGYDETFILNAQNQFTMRVSDLTRGVYHIEELQNTLYDVTYMLNNQSETSDGNIVLDGPDLQKLTIINTRTEMFYKMDNDHSLKIVIE